MFGRPFFAFHAAIVPKARLTLVQTAFWENDDQGSGWMSANRKLSVGWRKIPITLIDFGSGRYRLWVLEKGTGRNRIPSRDSRL